MTIENENTQELKEFTPLDLRSYQGPLYVRNLSNTKISHDDGKGNLLTLSPKNADDGSDFSVLPLVIAQHPGFQKMWRRNVLAVSSDPDMEEKLRFLDTQAAELEAQRSKSLQGEIVESPQNLDVAPNECLVCKSVVFKSQAELKEQPPLCDIHEDQASFFIRNEGEDEKVTWIRPVVTDTQKGK